ncbi:hypothetical protein [Methylobacterium bullatum]|uniref:Uncharacterized protein n=1 Tax=Methylobacterium bullatum TaxID=570505 RepID=A0A679K9Z8_9HYPH|nr:hypothetical protein MBLL_04748 [Methylobacterium bullatum]
MARSILKNLFSRASNPAPAPATEIAANRQAAERELVDARTAVEAAEAAYNAGLLSASDDALRGLDAARRDAGMRLDRAKALVGAFNAQLVEAGEAEKHAELSRIVEEAVTAQAAFKELCERDLPGMAAKARAMLALRDRAERATTAANKALAGAGEGSTLPPVEAFRAQPGRPREELRRETVELWVDHAGNAVGYQQKVKLESDGTGTLSLPNASHLHRLTRRRMFEIIETLPEVRDTQPTSLVTALSVPELYSPAPTADRTPETTMRPVGPARDVGRRPPERSERRA